MKKYPDNVDALIVLSFMLFIITIILLLITGIIDTKVSERTKVIAQSNEMQVIRVIDGDTVQITAPFLPQNLKKELALRIYGVDTPERGQKAKCKRERELSESAKTFVVNTLSSAKNIEIQLHKWDKYGGRVLGDLIIDGESLSSRLINGGLAFKYDGGKKKSWCGR